MIKLILSTLSFFVPMIVIIGQTAYEPIIDIKNDTVYKTSEDKPFTGNYREYYPGDIKVEGQFINGLKNGEFIYYNNSLGVIEYGYCSVDSIINYSQGLKDGIQKKFHICPQESSRKNFKNDFNVSLALDLNGLWLLTRLTGFNSTAGEVSWIWLGCGIRLITFN